MVLGCAGRSAPKNDLASVIDSACVRPKAAGHDAQVDRACGTPFAGALMPCRIVSVADDVAEVVNGVTQAVSTPQGAQVVIPKSVPERRVIGAPIYVGIANCQTRIVDRPGRPRQPVLCWKYLWPLPAPKWRGVG